MQILFYLLSGTALAAWCLLIIFPNLKLTRLAVRSLGLPMLLALVYFALLINEVAFGAASGNGGFTSISGIQGLFEAPNGAVLGWTHFLTFDLLVGIWIVAQSEAKGLSAWAVTPSLILTMLFGPLGFLTFMMFGSGKSHRSGDGL